ncbi:FixH family protein [Anoxybacillus sp. ST4]|uniref:FixH family protein n=1 Tax=Anoxybacillus sp. ST4 TaxID=2864181 RepID=UPI001C63E0E3|nr:FixH family protein [Anoxybacillus sp. ST4]MBW7651169.1 FixH family protein [Anoxybacillus sp. ST4]
MKKWSLLFLFILLVVAGCANNTEEEELAYLDVKMAVEEKLPANQEVELACLVTYGDEKVTDASEVKFEVWKHGTEDRQMIEGEHVGDGKYVARYTFAAKGTYSVVAHVTAKNMHNMPKIDVVVE